MAEEVKQNTEKSDSLIDPIYQKFVRSVIRSIGSTDFYEFFMDAVSRADNQIQFSNRRMEKVVELSWVDNIEGALQAFQNIVSSPRNVIREEDLIVNVANAKKASSETVRHLAMHSSLVDEYQEDSGDVRPGRLMQRYREETINLYENRLVFTTLEYAYRFVSMRHEALMASMSDEFGAKLKVNSVMSSASELVRMDMFLHIKEIEGALETDEKNGDVFRRIDRMYRILSILMNTGFSEQMSRLPRIKGNVTKTNVLKRNKDYRTISELWDFLRKYDGIGYAIKIVEQNPVVNETLQRDIFHNILFNYLILKGYLEDERDRRLPVAPKTRQRTLKPKYIHEIIEELTEDYDLPDVEIRKVLIEELTKQQLMQEEAAERRRLVEEQARRKKEEEERLKAEKKAEQERIKAEKAAERERIRQEKEAAEQQKLAERMEREMEDRRIAKLYRQAIDLFHEHLDDQVLRRAEQLSRQEEELEDFADAVQLMDEAEEMKREEAERERQRRAAEKERERLEAEAEAERLRQEKKAEAERIRAEQEAREAAALEAQRQEDMKKLSPVVEELAFFSGELIRQIAARKRQAEEARREEEEREQARLQRRSARTGQAD
jgi:hypothetical protein